MHSRRAILLASSALVGIGSLTVTAWQDQALGATVTFSGPSTTAVDNPIIAASAPPDITVVADATALIDTKTGGAPLTVPATFNGTVVVTNNGTIGLAVGDSAAFVGGASLQVIGDPTKSTDNVSITNNKIINGAVQIGTGVANGAGGTAALVNTLTITGKDGTAAGNGVAIWSTGDATVTSNAAGSIITGSVLVVSRAPAPVATVDGTGKITTTTTPGGNATVTLGDVGVVKGVVAGAPGSALAVSQAEFNPDLFAGSSVTLFGIKSVSAALGGHSGPVTMTSFIVGGTTIADAGNPVTDASGTTTLTTKAITMDEGGTGAVTVLAGAQVLGNISVATVGAETAQITGAIGTGAGTSLVLLPSAIQSEVDTTTVTDSKAIQLSKVVATSTANIGGGATVVIDPTGLLNGGLTVHSDAAQVITVNGQIGRLDTVPVFQATKGALIVAGNVFLEAAGQKSLDTKTTTWADVAGVQTLVSTVDVNNFNTDTGGDVTFNVGATGSIAGGTTVDTGGNLFSTIDGLLGTSKVGTVALNADLTMGNSLVTESAIDSTTTTTNLFDSTGLILTSNKVVTSNVDTGGGATVTIDPTGVVTGTVSITSNTAQNITLNGQSAGAAVTNGTWTLIGSANSNSNTATTTFDKTGLIVTAFSQTNNVNTDIGAPITFTEGATGKLTAPLVILTGGDVTASVSGTLGLGTVSVNALTIDSTFGFLGFGGNGGTAGATDQTTTENDTFDSTGAFTTQTKTDNRAATGGAVTVVTAATATISGNVAIVADGAVNFTNNGTVERAADGLPVSYANDGNVTIQASRLLQTQDNKSPIANNVVKTTPTAPAISPVETKNAGSETVVVNTVGGLVNFTNTSLNSIHGFVTVNALGNIVMNNSGWIVGDVKLTSHGTSTTTVTNASTDNLVIFGDTAVADAASQTQQTITTASSSTATTIPTGGSVAGTYSGIDAFTNSILDLTAQSPSLVPAAQTELGAGQANTVTAGVGNTVTGGIAASHIGIFQSADTTSTVTVSGTVYAGICSVVGDFCNGNQTKVILVGSGLGHSAPSPFGFGQTDGTTVVASTTNVVDVLNTDTTTTPGSALLTGGTLTANTTTSTSFTPAAGTASTVTISGNVLRGLGTNVGAFPQPPNLPAFSNTDSDVFSSADFGSTINVSGSVQGRVEADAQGASTSTTNTTSATFSIGGVDGTIVPPAGAPFVKDTNGQALETAFNSVTVVKQTGVGGAATVSITGLKGVYGALAFGASGATVTIDAASQVLSSPSRGSSGVWVSTAQVPNDITTTTTIARVYASTKATQTTTVATTNNTAAIAGNALATINGPVVGNVNVHSGIGNATATVNNYVKGSGPGTIAVGASANGTKVTTNTSFTSSATENALGPIKLTFAGAALETGAVPAPPIPNGGVVIPSADLGTALIPTETFGAFRAAKFSGSSTTVSAGGAATVTLTAPASVIAIGGSNISGNGILIEGDVNVNGDKSATAINNAGTIVDGDITALSLPTTIIDGMPDNSPVGAGQSPISIGGPPPAIAGGLPLISTTETFNSKGFLDARTRVQSTTFNGGTATVVNSGEVRGDGTGVFVSSEGTSTFTNNVTGVIGQFLGGTGANTNWFTSPSFSFVNTIQGNTSVTTVDSGLTDPFTLLADPTHGTTVVTSVFTPVGGTSVATNSGVIWGSIEVDGVVGTVTNNLGASIGSAFGGGGGGVFVGQAQPNWTIVQTTKSNSTTFSETFAPLFTQTYTINQSGVIAGGISVGGATLADPLGPLAVPPNVDAFGNTKQVKTSNIVATVNLNDRSVTIGDAAVSGQMGVLDSDLATFYTTTNVNLNGNDYIGLNTNAFGAFPILTTSQTQFLSTIFGISTDSIGLDAAFAAGKSIAPGTTLDSASSVVGVTALTRAAGGITYFTGVNYNNANSPRLVDDTYAIRVNTFTIASGGEMQFALDFQPIETFSSSSCSALFNSNFCSFNAPQPASNIFGISGAVTNNGTFVVGARGSEVAPANFGNFTVSSPSFVEGLTMRIDGSLTQSSTGVLVTGVAPTLVRVFEPFIGNPTVGEILGTPSNNLTLPFFTTPLKSGIPVSTPSLILLSGNLNLAGTVQVAVSRNSIYAANASTPLIIVTPSINPQTGVVSATAPTVSVTATATTSLPSPFVGFSLTTVTTGAGAATVTTVSLVTSRKSFSTAGTTSNAQAAGRALDSDLSSVVPQITLDANGGAAFTGVGNENNVQDEANIISALDFGLTSGQAGVVLADLGNGGFYGSVRAFDTTRVLRDGFDNGTAGITDMDKVGLSIWATPIFRSGTLDGNSAIGTSNINTDEGGVTAGVDFRFTNHIGFGVGGGYTKNRLKSTEANADVDSWLIGGNLYYVDGPIHVSGQIDYGRSNYAVDRFLPAMSRQAHAEFGGNETRGVLEAGYRFNMVAADGSLTPFIAIDYRNADTHAFSETGAGGVSLVVNGKSDNVFSPRVGLRWLGTPWGTTVFTVTPKVEGSYMFSNDMDTSATMHFAGGEDVIATQGIQGKGYGNIQLGLDGSVGSNGTIGIAGGFDFAGNRTATSIQLNFRIAM